jgi:hypothetical protein
VDASVKTLEQKVEHSNQGLGEKVDALPDKFAEVLEKRGLLGSAKVSPRPVVKKEKAVPPSETAPAADSTGTYHVERETKTVWSDEQGNCKQSDIKETWYHR